MSKEGWLISRLKPEQSIAKLCKSKSNSTGIEEIKEKFNVLRNNFSKEKIKKLEKYFIKRAKIDKYFREQEKKKQNKKKERKNITPKNYKRLESF